MSLLLPKNTNWNRKLQLTDLQGTLTGEKFGVVYFCFVLNGETIHFKCDEGIFRRHFTLENPHVVIPEINLTAEESRKYRKFPF